MHPFESVKKFLRRCDNKKNQRSRRTEFLLVLAQLDTEENILTKFKKIRSRRRCDNKKCLQTDSWRDGQTDAGEFPGRQKS